MIMASMVAVTCGRWFTAEFSAIWVNDSPGWPANQNPDSGELLPGRAEMLPARPGLAGADTVAAADPARAAESITAEDAINDLDQTARMMPPRLNHRIGQTLSSQS
jgi:hypothetical protein